MWRENKKIGFLESKSRGQKNYVFGFVSLNVVLVQQLGLSFGCSVCVSHWITYIALLFSFAFVDGCFTSFTACVVVRICAAVLRCRLAFHWRFSWLQLAF
ncbi:unnamed protein product [Lathyrus oleraceus]